MDVGPVEADAPGAFTQLGGARQRRQRQRHIGEFAGRFSSRRALTRLVLFPGAILIGGGFDPRIREYVRMPFGEFVGDGVGHAREIEPLPLRAHLRVKHDLEQQVTELAFERPRFAARDGFGNLVRLLDRVRRDAREILLPIPRDNPSRGRAVAA